MNKATKKPAACGFKMSSLAKFADTKTTDNKRNLVNFVCQYIHEKHPDLADWQEEVQDVVPAQRVMGDDVKNKFGDLQRITKKMDTVLQKLQGKEGNEEFIGHLSSVASEYQTLFLLIENDMKKWTVKYEEACKLYSEDAKKTKSEDFFANFKSFYEAYESAEKIYKEDAAKKEKERKKEEERQKKLEEAAKKVAAKEAKKKQDENMINDMMGTKKTVKKVKKANTKEVDFDQELKKENDLISKNEKKNEKKEEEKPVESGPKKIVKRKIKKVKTAVTDEE